MPSPELIRLGVTEWSEQLAGITGAQVKSGLAKWDSDWPPSCSEFRKICAGEAVDIHKTGAYKMFKALPRPKQDHALASSCLAEMKLAVSR